MMSSFQLRMLCWFIGITLSVIIMIFLPLWKVDRTRANRITILMTCILICIGAMALYLKIGSWDTASHINNEQVKQDNVQSELTLAKQAALKEPKNLDAVSHYARSLGKAGRHAEAAEQFRTAILLSKGRPDLILDYATAQIFANNGDISEEALKSVDMVLLIEPTEPKARYFKAMYLQQKGKTKEAENAFNALRASLKPDDTLIKLIDERLKMKNN
jgi:cytochrome c-type biogenesis protein CcmH